jgi:hypothetical protein
MKTSEINKDIKLLDYENFLEVYENERDDGKPYLYNLNSTIYFTGVPNNEMRLQHDMFWTTISY